VGGKDGPRTIGVLRLNEDCGSHNLEDYFEAEGQRGQLKGVWRDDVTKERVGHGMIYSKGPVMCYTIWHRRAYDKTKWGFLSLTVVLV